MKDIVGLNLICYNLYNKLGAKIMKVIGIVREVNQLGRTVLPMELRRTMDICV